jgi:MFS family permease
MPHKFSTRIRKLDINLHLLAPLLVSTTLVQAVAALMRITTSYRAVEMGLSVTWVGVISATFSLLPIFVALWVGRFIDRGYDAAAAWIGATLLVIGCGGCVLWAGALPLLIFTAILGTGHLFLMASQQMLCLRCAEGRNLESVFGNYMVAGALGQGLGPYIVGLAGGSATLPPTQLLFTIGLIAAIISLAVVLTIRPGPKKTRAEQMDEIVPISALLRVPGLVPIITAGVLVMAASDVVIIYLPLLGAERGFDVKYVGMLLTVRAGASLLARMFYARSVAMFGRRPLIIGSTLAFALSLGALAVPLPLFVMIALMAVVGIAFGYTTTLSITMVVDMTTAGAQGTANSLRIMGNRTGQFVLPMSAGVVAAATGIAGILLVIAVAVAASAAAILRSKPVPDKPAPVR